MNADHLTLAEIHSLLDPRGDEQEIGLEELAKSTVEIHQRTADRFATAVSELIGDEVLAAFVETERIVFGEYLLGVAKPSYFHPAKADPNLADLFLETSAAATGMLLDCLLGSAPLDVSLPRLPATETEQRLFGRLVAMFWEAFRSAWGPIEKFELTSLPGVTDYRSIRCARADDEVNLLKFRVAVGKRTADIRCCLPADWLARLFARRIADRRKTSGGDDKQQAAGPAALDVVVSLAETTMTPHELADLQVGKLIATGKDVGQPLDVSIDGAVAFRANLDKSGNKKAVRIVEKVPPPESDIRDPEK